jgi:DNA-binding response OmpR family regulator
MRSLPLTHHAEEPVHEAARVDAPTLFVVDDDVATLELLCEIGRGAGWTARGFTCLAALQASLEEMNPALLILDDDLPDGRGGDLARRLREDRRMAEIPILVCTAAHPMRAAEIGAWAPVISKPFDLAEIEAFLGAAARSHEGSDDPYRQRAG